jgi:hypothetical protein
MLYNIKEEDDYDLERMCKKAVAAHVKVQTFSLW